MVRRFAKELARIIKQIDNLLWENLKQNDAEQIREGRKLLFDAMDKSGWNFDRNYKIYEVKNANSKTTI